MQNEPDIIYTSMHLTLRGSKPVESRSSNYTHRINRKYAARISIKNTMPNPRATYPSGSRFVIFSIPCITTISAKNEGMIKKAYVIPALSIFDTSKSLSPNNKPKYQSASCVRVYVTWSRV